MQYLQLTAFADVDCRCELSCRENHISLSSSTENRGLLVSLRLDLTELRVPVPSITLVGNGCSMFSLAFCLLGSFEAIVPGLSFLNYESIGGCLAGIERLEFLLRGELLQLLVALNGFLMLTANLFLNELASVLVLSWTFAEGLAFGLDRAVAAPRGEVKIAGIIEKYIGPRFSLVFSGFLNNAYFETWGGGFTVFVLSVGVS